MQRQPQSLLLFFFFFLRQSLLNDALKFYSNLFITLLPLSCFRATKSHPFGLRINTHVKQKLDSYWSSLP